MESIVGANGVILPPDGYMEGVRALCDKYGIMMICDEVMAGFFRTGKWFAWQNFDIKPDMITFAKGVTCGYVPLGGVIVNEKVAEYFEENVLQCGLTYSVTYTGLCSRCCSDQLLQRSQDRRTCCQNARDRSPIYGSNG